ncbi:MAG: OsmC family protein [Phycisphaerae bacterium]
MQDERYNAVTQQEPGNENSPRVVVTARGEDFAQSIQVRHHQLKADEPAAVGGSDTGPDPYELLLSSLGACTSLTVQMYAKRKDWPLEQIEVGLSHHKIHARDCEDCESETGYVDIINKSVKLEGALTGEQEKRLLEIADRCPVQKTLTNEVKIISDA